MPLTTLNTHMAGATAIGAALAAMYGGVSTQGILAFIAGQIMLVVTCPAPRDPSLTVQDRCTMHQERLTSGKQPGGGTISIVMHINNKNLPQVEVVRAAMTRVVAKLPRFASIVVEAAAVDDATWRTVDVDMAQHVVEHAAAASSESHQRLLDELIYTDLPRNIPLWRFDILPNAATGRGCVLLRASHALGDGMRLVSAMAPELLTYADGTPAVLELLSRMASNKVAAARTPRGILNLAKDLFDAATLDQVRDEDATCFHAPGTLFPRAAPRTNVTSSVPLDDLKAVKTTCAPGTTLNDVLLAAFVGALRAYAQAVGRPIEGAPLLRALCAVSLPTPTSRRPDEMFNDLLLPSITLPVGTTSRASRLQAVRAVMSETKQSRAGFFMKMLLAAVARLGLDPLIGHTQLAVFSKHAFVYSNLPGFTRPVHLFEAKAKVESFAVYYPNLVSQLCVTRRAEPPPPSLLLLRPSGSCSVRAHLRLRL